MKNSDAPLGLGEERVPPGEDAAIKTIVDANMQLLDTGRKPVPRAQHPKQHGCVDAQFIVEPDLPATLRHGVFREPKSYRAIVRFSNGRKWDDREGDAHGMAVKLFDVGASGSLPAQEHSLTQDFVMFDHPVFFVRNAADYVTFSRAVVDADHAGLADWVSRIPHLSGLSEPLRKLILSAEFFRLHELIILGQVTGKTPHSPLQVQYWSATPYRLGPHAIRFTAVPDPTDSPPPPASDSPDRLREAMVAHLQAREARFEFRVQLQTHPVHMPVEDPTIKWDERASPYQKVATIRIDKQSFTSAEQMTHCENLSFSPWHTLPEHQPLGGINRVRRTVYEALSHKRRELNGVPPEGG